MYAEVAKPIRGAFHGSYTPLGNQKHYAGTQWIGFTAYGCYSFALNDQPNDIDFRIAMGFDSSALPPGKERHVKVLTFV
jgi:hypothetical protein